VKAAYTPVSHGFAADAAPGFPWFGRFSWGARVKRAHPHDEAARAVAVPQSSPLADDGLPPESFGAVAAALGVVTWLLLVTVAAVSPLFF
jgi:hypothetical protein